MRTTSPRTSWCATCRPTAAPPRPELRRPADPFPSRHLRYTMTTSRKILFGKLGETLFRSIESATLFCKMRGNPYVELAHWLHQLLQVSDSDLLRLLRHFQVDSARLARDLTESLDKLPRGATSVSDLSIQVEDSVERGWVYASLQFGAIEVRTGH